MVNYSVKNARITMFTLLIVVLLSACSEKKLPSNKTKHRDVAAVHIQKNMAEIYVLQYSTPGLEEEDFFAIKSKTDHSPLERQLKNPLKVFFSNQQEAAALNN